jgi:hypothetical protein
MSRHTAAAEAKAYKAPSDDFFTELQATKPQAYADSNQAVTILVCFLPLFILFLCLYSLLFRLT